MDKEFKRGFTLIELLVVVSIISLLSSIILASVNSARAKSRDAARVSTVHSLVNAIYLATSANNGNFPSSGGTGVCIGLNTGSTCWDGSVSGNTAFTTALQPYMSQFPTDPLRTSGIGDRYIYADSSTLVAQACSVIQPSGPFIIYQPDVAQPSGSGCPLGSFMACCGAINCSNGYYCAYKIP